MYVTLEHEESGKSRNLRLGFSWFFLFTTPFYGIPQFVMGIWKYGLAVAALGVLAVLTVGQSISSLIGLALIAAAIVYGIKGGHGDIVGRLARIRLSTCHERGVR